MIVFFWKSRQKKRCFLASPNLQPQNSTLSHDVHAYRSHLLCTVKCCFDVFTSNLTNGALDSIYRRITLKVPQIFQSLICDILKIEFAPPSWNDLVNKLCRGITLRYHKSRCPFLLQSCLPVHESVYYHPWLGSE